VCLMLLLGVLGAVINNERDGACSLYDGATGAGCTPYAGYLPPYEGSSYSVSESGSALVLTLWSGSSCGGASVGNTYSVSPSSPYAGVYCCNAWLTNPNMPAISCLRYWDGEHNVAPYEISQFSIERFNALRWYEDVRVYAAEKSSLAHVRAMLKIIDTTGPAGIRDWLGIALLHKHFELLDGEVLLEKLSDDHTSDSRPTPVKDVSAPLPHMFAFATAGQIQPLEYLDDAPYAMRQQIHQLLFTNSTKPMLAQVHRYLSQNGLLSIFGIGIVHRQKVAEADPHGRQVETSNLQQRWLHVRPFNRQSTNEVEEFREKQKTGLATNTFWTVGRDGGTNSSLDCSGHCNGHCNHCTAHCGLHCGACCSVH
jgi:hypothetical protein